MPPECNCDWSIMSPSEMGQMSNTQKIVAKVFKPQSLCPHCSGWVSNKKFSGAIYILEEADIQGRTIDTIFCEDKKEDWV